MNLKKTVRVKSKETSKICTKKEKKETSKMTWFGWMNCRGLFVWVLVFKSKSKSKGFVVPCIGLSYHIISYFGLDKINGLFVYANCVLLLSLPCHIHSLFPKAFCFFWRVHRILLLYPINI